MQKLQPLSQRILSRLANAIADEPDPWLQDDLKIAKLTVLHAALGDAVGCSPLVLASYEVLGLHPDKVWPSILSRRDAWGPLEVLGVPKKPPQSVKLWSEKLNGARAVNSRAAMQTVLHEPRILPMATASIAALYPNSDASPSAKKREFTYGELLNVVKFSGAPHSVKYATLNALSARGRWPHGDGPVNGIICVSLKGMMLGNKEGVGNVVRSTARWRARRAVKLGYWRRLRAANSWSDCPKCETPRNASICEKCGYQGRSKTPEGKANFDEFCRPFMYEIDIEKFRRAERPKGLLHFEERTYDDHKEAAKRGEHPNVTEIPRKQPAPDPQPPSPPPATAAPLRQPVAEHAHRNPLRASSVVGGTSISDHATKAAQLLMEMCGLADIGAIPQMAISITAEAKYRGMEVEDAAKFIAECATRDQKKGIVLTRFYFRDMKWRSDGTTTSASSERADRIKRNILDGFAANARRRDQPDGTEFEE